MKKNTGIVFNIQRFTIHDGPGTRTEVFLKGCPMSCKWCSNPESINPKREVGVYSTKCMGKDVCGSCIDVCSLGGAPLLFNSNTGKIGAIDRSVCIGCMKCTEVCFMRALKSWGNVMTVEDVMKEVRADKNFYSNSGGGMTISGGETMIQWQFALELLKACKDERINTCVETSMMCAPEPLEELYPYTDLMITDIKNMNTEEHKKWSGCGNERILNNIEKTVKAGLQVIIRVPIIPSVNDTEENIRATAEFIRDKLDNRVLQVQLLTYLKMGEEKYKSLGIEYPMGEDFNPEKRDIREKWIAHLAEIMREYGAPAVAGSTTEIS